ncbi:MAG: 2Fe-2S iron-sulfur cluster binding domain-containing protein [Anaerolineae bacterium]|nr:2Fe-2S iron-sulfur cluster binding domain-containing protein [Anaerolineae bacterium]
MTKDITLTIDGKEVSVPDGTLVVDAAKKAGIDIPVFCYHPKMEPVGMCRQCLVEIGRPAFDRATGDAVLEEDGSPKINWGWKLETSCTNPASEGMVVNTKSEKAVKGQNDRLEFQLLSHPLDCPVCDKGGECLLQDLTLAHGSAESRFNFDEKRHSEKKVALSDLIWLDRERCIQCARCVRFQSDIAGEAVLGFEERGSHTQIMTTSDPGFDSVFSGNTTDICPVGALTTAKFRFGARPWEMEATASVCAECPVGCNTVLNTRRDVKSGGKVVVKRVMPRQNEAVNETWICDKGRFADFSTDSRLTTPSAGWTEAIANAAQNLSAADEPIFVVDGSLPNEDLFNIKSLADEVGAKAYCYSEVGGGALTTKSGSYGESGAGDAILVIGSDLYADAPIFWLRAKQAVDRGATLIVATEEETRLDSFAATVTRNFEQGLDAAKEAFAKAENTVILYKGDDTLAQSCADLNPTSLVGVWDEANTQGAWEMGYEAISDLDALKGKTVYVAGKSALVASALEIAKFVVAQTAEDVQIIVGKTVSIMETSGSVCVTLPSRTVSESVGTFTSAERRVQLFHPAVQALGDALPGFVITAQIAEKMGVTLDIEAEDIFSNFSDLSYTDLAKVNADEKLSIGGTCYENEQGVGVKLPAKA